MRFATPVIVVATLNFTLLRLGSEKLIIFYVVFHYNYYFSLPVDCRETERSKRTKRPRAPEPAVNFEPEPQQDLENEESGSQEKDLPEIPDNFLSPSVREYLELGKSIPGKHYNNRQLHQYARLAIIRRMPRALFDNSSNTL